MCKNLILSLILSVMFVGGAFAQSADKGGSSSKGGSGYSSSSKAAIKADRALAKEKSKLVSKMTRRDFAAVKLDKEQRQTLKQLVDDNYEKMTQLDDQINTSIPADQVKALQKAYRAAKRDGGSEKEAMSASMISIALPEAIQEKVGMFNKSKEEVMASIRSAVVDTFDADQKSLFDEAMAKKEMAAKEEMGGEEMSDKEMMDKEMMDKEMMDKEMMDKEMSDKEMTDKEMTDKEMTDKEMMDEKVMDEKVMMDEKS